MSSTEELAKWAAQLDEGEILNAADIEMAGETAARLRELEASRDGWEADAKREHQNAEHWRNETARLRAALERITDSRSRGKSPEKIAREALKDAGEA